MLMLSLFLFAMTPTDSLIHFSSNSATVIEVLLLAPTCMPRSQLFKNAGKTDLEYTVKSAVTFIPLAFGVKESTSSLHCPFV